jgi:hypothetical protein
MDTKELLNEQYNDNDTESEDLNLEELHVVKTPRKCHVWDKALLWRVLMDSLVLVGVSLTFILITQREHQISRPECVQHHLPVGSDLSGFVPSGRF